MDSIEKGWTEGMANDKNPRHNTWNKVEIRPDPSDDDILDDVALEEELSQLLKRNLRMLSHILIMIVWGVIAFLIRTSEHGMVQTPVQARNQDRTQAQIHAQTQMEAQAEALALAQCPCDGCNYSCKCSGNNCACNCFSSAAAVDFRQEAFCGLLAFIFIFAGFWLLLWRSSNSRLLRRSAAGNRAARQFRLLFFNRETENLFFMGTYIVCYYVSLVMWTELVMWTYSRFLWYALYTLLGAATLSGLAILRSYYEHVSLGREWVTVWRPDDFGRPVEPGAGLGRQQRVKREASHPRVQLKPRHLKLRPATNLRRRNTISAITYTQYQNHHQ